MSLSEKLLEAHLEHELSALQGPGLQESLSTELGQLFDWLGKARLQDLVPSAPLKAQIVATLRDYTPTAELREAARKHTTTLLLGLHSRPELLGDLVPDPAFESSLEHATQATELRAELIRLGVHSPIFANLLSEILFTSIQDFMSDTQAMTGRVPGAGRLLRFGQDLVNQAVPALGQNFERIIKDFIRKNIGKTIKNSEEYLNRSMKPELLREAGRELWADVSKSQVSRLPEYLNADRLESYEEPALLLWENLRKSELLGWTLNTWVDSIFEVHGGRPAAELLKALGLDREQFQNALLPILIPIFEEAHKSGYLKARIEARLRSFYESDAAQKLLG